MYLAVKIFALVIIVPGIIAVLRFYWHRSFRRQSVQEKLRLFAQVATYRRFSANTVTHHCPLVVMRWLQRTGAMERDQAQTVELYQTGSMRTSPAGRWMPFSAEQCYTTFTPGFLWTASVKAMPGIPLLGRDVYIEGHGDMQIKLDGIFPVANAHGSTIDQGSLVRFLAEIVWFPSAVLAPYIQWEQVDTVTAKATINYGGIEDNVMFHFDAYGDVVRLNAARYYSRGNSATLEKWEVRVLPGSYKTFSGIRVPSALEVTWGLKEGDFTWLKLTVTDIEYNKALQGLRVRHQIPVGS